MTTTTKSRLTMVLAVAVVMNTALLAGSYFQIGQMKSAIEKLKSDTELRKDGKFVPLGWATLSSR